MEKRSDILSEIRELSPLLASLKEDGSQPFLVPDGYFEALSQDVFLSVDAGIAEVSSKAAFSIPEDYFDRLTDEIMDRVEQEDEASKQPAGRVIALDGYRNRKRLPMRRLATIAAAIALFLTFGIATTRILQPGSGSEPAMAVSNEEVIEYIEENIYTFESEELYAYLASSGSGSFLEVSEDMDDAIDQYLEENIDEFDEFLFTSEI